MSKDTITIDGETYVKQAGPSKEEIDAAEKFCARSRKRCGLLSMSLCVPAALLFSNILAGFVVFFMTAGLYSIVMYSVHKTKFSKEVWDAITPAYQPSSGGCSYASGTFRNRLYRDS